MSDLYEYQAIDGSSKGPVSLVLLIQARNHGRLSNRTLVRKLPDGGWQPLSSFIPSMTVMDADMEESAMPEPETGSIGRGSLRDGAVLKDVPENRRCARFIPPWASRGWSWQGFRPS